MMASNILSRMLPPTTGSPSVYEAIREHDQMAEEASREHQATPYHDEDDDHAIDEHNLQEPFQGPFEEQDLENLLVEAAESQLDSTENTPFLDNADTGQDPQLSRAQPLQTSPTMHSNNRATPRWMRGPRRRSRTRRHFAIEDDVPESLLLEEGGRSSPEDNMKTPRQLQNEAELGLPPPIPGPSSRSTRSHWNSTRARQALYDEELPAGPNISAKTTPLRQQKRPSPIAGNALLNADPAQKALWRWTNVENLDNFLQDVYVYYLDKGIYSIMLSRVLGLMTGAFVVGIVTFLGNCIDFGKLRDSNKLEQILIPKCTKNMSSFTYTFIWLFALLWIIKLFDYIFDIRRLKHLHDFYLYLLGIPDEEMQTISWQDVVGRLMSLRDSNPRTALKLAPHVTKFLGSDKSKQRMDAHDIANRLMRRENYLIALFNKDILDLTLPIPFLRNRQLFSKTLEWSINLAVIDYVFNEQGQIRQLFLKDTDRQRLIDALRLRFKFVGIANIICAPFIIAYLLFFYFLRYFTEFQKNPSQLGSRAYSPLAEWKFREFNELRHLFERRTDMSYPYASRYMDQFPKHKTVELAKFVAFVAGALAAILALVTFLDPDLFLGFEITHDRTVFFYLGTFGAVWAVARGMVPDENLVFDPEFAVQEVINYTHYYPSHWRGRLHTDDVRREFSTLYQLKTLIFVEEILSIIFTPFVLWFSLPKCSERLIDFFREFTVHVDGLGYVCSFALFDFKKGAASSKPLSGPGVGGRAGAGAGANASAGLRDDYYSTKDGKMLASYYSFLDSYANNNGRRGNISASGHKRHQYNQYRQHSTQQQQFQPPPTFPGLSSSTAISPGLMGGPQQGHGSVGRSNIYSASPPQSMLLDGYQPPVANQARNLRGWSASGMVASGGGSGKRSSVPRQPSNLAVTQSILADDVLPPPALVSPTGHEQVAERPADEALAGPAAGIGSPAVGPGAARAGAGSGAAAGIIEATGAGLGEEGEDADEADEADEEDGFNASASAGAAGGAGVLGLLYQFQKAQTETARGKGAGIGI